jgi:hypothetical protein
VFESSRCFTYLSKLDAVSVFDLRSDKSIVESHLDFGLSSVMTNTEHVF